MQRAYPVGTGPAKAGHHTVRLTAFAKATAGQEAGRHISDVLD